MVTSGRWVEGRAGERGEREKGRGGLERGRLGMEERTFVCTQVPIQLLTQ